MSKELWCVQYTIVNAILWNAGDVRIVLDFGLSFATRHRELESETFIIENLELDYFAPICLYSSFVC
jgi:hypothetical protein